MRRFPQLGIARHAGGYSHGSHRSRRPVRASHQSLRRFRPPPGRRSGGGLCHYARFAELFYGASYEEPDEPIEITPETEPLFFRGHAIGWPVVINTLAVPSESYAKILILDPNGAAVSKDLAAFDAAYAQALAALDLAWNGPQAASWKTVGLSGRGVRDNAPGMIDMHVLGRENITRHQIPPSIVTRLAKLYPAQYGLPCQVHRPRAAGVLWAPFPQCAGTTVAGRELAA
jgi:hypothetical protein